MSIAPKCNKCKNELKEFGGILLSPPNKDLVKKFHLCKECYAKVYKIINKK